MDKNLFLKIVFVFIIILIIAGSGFYGFKILKDINEIEKQVDQALITKLPLTPKDKPELPPEDLDSSEIDTSDWLTYRNEEYGFEVKYPRGWTMRDILAMNESLRWLEDTVLYIGFSPVPEDVYAQVQVTTKPKDQIIYSYIKAFEKNGYTYILIGDDEFVSTFKFIR